MAGKPFEKGHPALPGSGRPKGSVALKKRIEQCANFMDTEGWLIAIDIARMRNRESVKALELLANYGYGKPIESIDLTSGGDKLTLADFFSRAIDVTPIQPAASARMIGHGSPHHPPQNGGQA